MSNLIRQAVLAKQVHQNEVQSVPVIFYFQGGVCSQGTPSVYPCETTVGYPETQLAPSELHPFKHLQR